MVQVSGFLSLTFPRTHSDSLRPHQLMQGDVLRVERKCLGALSLVPTTVTRVQSGLNKYLLSKRNLCVRVKKYIDRAISKPDSYFPASI